MKTRLITPRQQESHRHKVLRVSPRHGFVQHHSKAKPEAILQSIYLQLDCFANDCNDKPRKV
jgi:hypothetical protein